MPTMILPKFQTNIKEVRSFEEAVELTGNRIRFNIHNCAGTIIEIVSIHRKWKVPLSRTFGNRRRSAGCYNRRT